MAAHFEVETGAWALFGEGSWHTVFQIHPTFKCQASTLRGQIRSEGSIWGRQLVHCTSNQSHPHLQSVPDAHFGATANGTGFHARQGDSWYTIIQRGSYTATGSRLHPRERSPSGAGLHPREDSWHNVFKPGDGGWNTVAGSKVDNLQGQGRVLVGTNQGWRLEHRQLTKEELELRVSGKHTAK